MRTTLPSWAALSACSALALLHSAPAHAYCRTNSCDAARGENCSVDANGCRQGAKQLYWGATKVTFSVQADGSVKNHITAATFEKVIANAFETWSMANCGSGRHPSINAVNAGEVASSVIGYDPTGSNQNTYVFRDDTWVASIPGSALALTTVSYDWKTGQIYDADVEVNGTAGNITDGRPTDGADLPSIVTHEIGHFLGLDHSPLTTATMFITYVPGKGNLRALSADDIAGVCTIYPPTVALSREALSEQVEISEAPLAGCALSTQHRSQSGYYFGLIAAVGAVLGERRARRARRQP
jgi:hypothetical protein